MALKTDLIMTENMSEEPLISVIVPVYKVEDKLSRCVESVFAQTDSHWELILVDDGSPDNSGRLCDEYAAQDSRVRVLHQANAGVSAARNAGMAIAQGDWWAFVDSDDSIAPTFLEDFLAALRTYPSLDMYFGDVTQKKINGDTFVQYHHPQRLCSLYDAYERYQLQITGDATAKVFRAAVIRENAIAFPVGIHFAEDYVFLMSYLLHTGKVFLSSKVCYTYYRSEGSLSTTTRYDFEKERRCAALILPIAEKLAQQLGLPLAQLWRRPVAMRLVIAALRELSVQQYCRYVSTLQSVDLRYWYQGVQLVLGRLTLLEPALKRLVALQYYLLKSKIWLKDTLLHR